MSYISNNQSSLPPILSDESKPVSKIYDCEEILRCFLENKIISEGLKREIVELVEQIPQDVIGEMWQNYVIFKDPKVAVSLKYDRDQERYGNWMHHTIKIGVSGLKEKGWSFNELLHFFRFGRQYIASDSRFGCLREIEMETSFYEDYPYMTVHNFYNKYLPDSETCRLKNVSEIGKKFIHVGRINQEKIKLSKILISRKPTRIFGKNHFGSLDHTKVKKIDRIMNFVETKLYPEAMKEDDRAILIKKLGTIFWWICQAKPWRLGDPSIAETLIRTIWTSKGFESPSWKDGIVPWVEVSNEPDVEKFAENFHTLFK